MQYSKYLLLTIVCTAGLIFVIDLGEILRSHDGTTTVLILKSTSKTINNIVELMPLSVLIATITTFMILARRSEMVVFATLGVSNIRIISSMICVITALYIGIITILLPINQILTSMGTQTENKFIAVKLSETRFFRADRNNSNSLSNVSIWELDKNFILYRTVLADGASIDENQVTLLSPTAIYRNKTEKLDRLQLEFNISNITIAGTKPQAVNLIEIPTLVQKLGESGLQTTQYERYLWMNLTSIISFIIMCLWGFSQTFHLLRRTFNKFRILYCLAIGVLIFFSGNLMTTICLSRGFSVLTSVLLSRISQILMITIFRFIAK